jgi:DNA-binding NarL/FixJ family response regulator
LSGLSDCVLVVDDEPFIAELWCIHLQVMGLRVCGVAATAESAVALAHEHRPSLVLMDVRLRGKADGIDAALAINASVGSRIIVITGSREPETIARIKTADPVAVLYKPVSDRQMHFAIRQALGLDEGSAAGAA